MNSELITALIATGSSICTALVTWILARKKNNVEIAGSELDNVDKAVKIWRDTAEALKKQLEDYMIELREANRIIESLEEKINEIGQEVKNLQFENSKLSKMVDNLKNKQNA